jgi:hypothetical protein
LQLLDSAFDMGQGWAKTEFPPCANTDARAAFACPTVIAIGRECWRRENSAEMAVDNKQDRGVERRRLMRKNRVRGVLFPGAAAVLAAALHLGATPAASAAEPYKAPRTADGKADLNGIWQTLNTANWDLQEHAARTGLVVALGAVGAEPGGLGVVEGGEIPYLPEAAAKKKANFEKRLTDDPEIKCYLPGVPRATYMPYPFQIVQTPKSILIAYEYAGAARTIYMDKVPPGPADSWMGHSVGHWEGDTLVVDVTAQNDETWFDRAGDFHSDALHVTERYTPLSPDALMYETTIEDSKVFSRPWKISMLLYRRLEKNAQLTEFKCVEFVEELLYGHLRKQAGK